MDAIIDLQHRLYEGVISGLDSGDAFHAAAIPVLFAAGWLFGLVHALMPGHGKAVLASYHLGTGGHMVRAALDGVIVSLLQVGLAIAIVLLGWPLIRRNLQGEITAPLMEQASAVLILAIGIGMLLTRFLKSRRRREAPRHALAVAAGLVPCPVTAFVMIYAIFTGAIASGLTVVGGYAAGMAMTIAAFPVLAVAMRGRLLGITWFSERHHVLQVPGALAVIAFGCWLLVS